MFHTAKEASFFNLIMTGRDSFSIRIVEWKALQEGYTPFHFKSPQTFRKVIEILNRSF